MSLSIRILHVGQYLLAVFVLFQIKNSYVWVRNCLNTTIDFVEDVHNSRRSGINSRKYLTPDLSWIKYGEEDVDWALLVNAWLCVQNKKGNESSRKSKNEKELVIYSHQHFNLTEVWKVHPLICSVESSLLDLDFQPNSRKIYN